RTHGGTYPVRTLGNGSGQRDRGNGRKRTTNRRRKRAALRRSHQESRCNCTGRTTKVFRRAGADARGSENGRPDRFAPGQQISHLVHASRAEQPVHTVFVDGSLAVVFEREIAPARTFVYYEDVKPLMDKNLIKGGSLENAIVVRGDAVLSKEPLRFDDEFVRHKILDIIGDLALVGRRIRGHIVAVKPGHASNADLARSIAREQTRRSTLAAPRTIPSGDGGLDADQIMQILPHRFPFLMVDRIINFETEIKCVGVKTVTINEPYFQGHFPGHPVMPGVMQVEAMAQVASILLFKLAKTTSRIGYFMSADGVKFRKPVLPGDTIFIHAELTKSRGERLAKAKCHCVVNDAVVSEAELMFTFLDK